MIVAIKKIAKIKIKKGDNDMYNPDSNDCTTPCGDCPESGSCPILDAYKRKHQDDDNDNDND